MLLKATGAGECLLGRTWGYDATGVWVSEGCSGEFALGPLAVPQGAPPPAPPPRRPQKPETEQWGEFSPGDGFLIGRSDAGELSISAYALVRYIDQMPGTQTFTDHLCNERTVDAGRGRTRPRGTTSFRIG